jgi:hypothetical protein
VQHPSLLPTLARILREDGRRSLELAGAVVSAFFALSTVRQLHAPLSELQVGAAVMELCQLEVTRTAQRIAEDGTAAALGPLAARVAAAACGSEAELSDWCGTPHTPAAASTWPHAIPPHASGVLTMGAPRVPRDPTPGRCVAPRCCSASCSSCCRPSASCPTWQTTPASRRRW